MTLTDEELLAIRNAHEEEYGQYCDQDDFLMVARTIEARVHEELRKQEPVARPHNQGISATASIVTAGGSSTGESRAPIPPTPTPTPATEGELTACPHGVPHCWPCESCDVPTPNLMLLKGK